MRKTMLFATDVDLNSNQTDDTCSKQNLNFIGQTGAITKYIK